MKHRLGKTRTYMTRLSICTILSILVFISFSCSPEKPHEKTVADNGEIKESLLNANKQTVSTEDEQIRNLIERYGWKMEETGTGLRYLIYHKGNGPEVHFDKIVSINFEIRLITGDLVYSSKESGIKEFKVGSGSVESGLEEGILLLHVGDKAKFIVPSHLAWGLIGDQERIPPKSTLIYDVEVLNMKESPESKRK
jgi:FKBP-type peptidyl-prolyl cis-trans isomerase FkpA